MTNNPYHDLNLAPGEYEALINAPHTKSSASNGNGGCITWAASGNYISIQDDKLPTDERTARAQVYTRAELAAFVTAARAGELDHLI